MYHRPKQLLVNRANIPVKQDRRLLQIHLLTQANLRIPCKSLPFEAHRMWRVEPKGIVGQSSKGNNLIGKWGNDSQDDSYVLRWIKRQLTWKNLLFLLLFHLQFFIHLLCKFFPVPNHTSHKTCHTHTSLSTSSSEILVNLSLSIFNLFFLASGLYWVVDQFDWNFRSWEILSSASVHWQEVPAGPWPNNRCGIWGSNDHYRQ